MPASTLLASGPFLFDLLWKFFLGVTLVIAVWFMAFGSFRSEADPRHAIGYYAAMLACAGGACWCFLTLFR